MQRVEERASDKNIREYCFKELQKLESGSMDEAFYSPIILVGDNQLTYEVVQDFLVTKRKTVLINQSVASSALKKNDADFIGLVSSNVVDGNVLALVQ